MYSNPVTAAIQGLRKAYKMAKLTAKLANTGMKLMRKAATSKVKKLLLGRVKGAVFARALRSRQQMEEYHSTAKKASVGSMIADKITLSKLPKDGEQFYRGSEKLIKRSHWTGKKQPIIRLKINVPSVAESAKAS